ncbi:uncharacterized protein LOC115677283 [Syzygium oleosum]|uniref:uncharacterized protein LOC115677283 n=1 Tax=Syzygium oleosum TaxID=219896 RepID=UPI0024B8C9B1|nr:uncharacterized protein LOC115677283 [Syzygium oleosum]
MSERDDAVSLRVGCAAALSPAKTLLDSLAVLLRNKRLFLSLFAAAALPLSVLLFSLAVSAHPLQSRVLHLESLARLAPTRFESRQVLKESRAAALSLLRLRASYSLPSLALSLAAAVSAVGAAHASLSGRRPTLRSSLSPVREKFPRALATAICVHASMWIYLSVPATLVAVTGSRGGARFLIVAAGLAAEIYLAAVLGLGMVVSVVEERFGWGAIRAGWGLMGEGGRRRWGGWALSGFFAALTGWIWRAAEVKMDGQDWGSVEGMVRWTVGVRWRAWLIPAYGGVVLWSYVAATVFYCECTKRRPPAAGGVSSSNRGGRGGGEGEMIPLAIADHTDP